MRYVLYGAIVTSFFASHTLFSGEVITFFVRAYPIGTPYIGRGTFNCDPTKSLKNNEYCLQAGMRTTIVAGIFFSYAGFLDISTMSGQVIFPRRWLQPDLQFLITDKLTPILIVGNTIDHWELEAGTPAQLYNMKRSWDDAARLFYWEVSAADLPEDKQHSFDPRNTIIMFAKPRHVYVPLGATPTTGDPNLILPDIYVRQPIQTPANSMYLLSLRQFFGPIGVLNQKTPLHQSFHLYDWGHEIR
jgi:hypothetical protein